MGMGKSGGAPNAPSYAPQQQAALQAFQSDMAASQNLYGLAGPQLGYGNQLTAASTQAGQDFMGMTQDARNWGLQQFNTVWPYALDYLNSQQALSNLAGENASEAVIAAREGRARADDTYRRYLDEVVPIEQQFFQEARNYNSPERASQASARARADVYTAASAADKQREDELRSYGIDPSEERYQGAGAISDVYTSAAAAGAGTQSREQSYLTGLGLLKDAATFGQTLPTQSLAQMQAATGGANSALQVGQVGGQGLTAASGTMQVGGGVTGLPAQYAGYSNPYTQLAGQQAGLTSNLYSTGTSALGNLGPIIKGSADAQSSAFSNQLASYNADLAAEQAMWGGIGKAVGGIGSIALAPVTGGGSLIGNAMTKALG